MVIKCLFAENARTTFREPFPANGLPTMPNSLEQFAMHFETHSRIPQALFRQLIRSACLFLTCFTVGFGDDQDSQAKSGQSIRNPTDAKSAAGTKKSVPKSKKVRAKKRVQRLFVQQGFYRSDEDDTDLTSRFQKAVTDDLLVVFVEKSLSDDKKKKTGELYLQVQLDGELSEHKVGHRKFIYLDARDPPKIPLQGLAILDAWYGTGIWGEDKMVDVKRELSGKVVNNQVNIEIKDLVAGIPDPAPGSSKALIVRYAINGVSDVVMFEEHQTIELGGQR